ncbi:MAG TPA: ion transporter [Victivallales bacterium]|nr:ion transporter [Victivallales bacterium]
MSDVVNTCMVAIYITVRCVQVAASRSSTEEILGSLSDVPWSSSTVEFKDKMLLFEDGFHRLTDLLKRERSMSTFRNFTMLLVMLRLIVATRAHPRIAILVDTAVQAADDLWHFLILMILVYFSFGEVALVQFGSELPEFSTPVLVLQSQFDMMLGGLPDGFLTDSLFAIYVLSFNVVVFFLMLNFLLAIIVEAYMRVTGAADKKNKTGQEFFSDIYSTSKAMLKTCLHGWPRHSALIMNMEGMSVKKTVGVSQLRVFFPSWQVGVRGLPARGYFMPGRDGAGVRRLGIVPCRRRVSSSRDRVGMQRVGVRARHTSPDKETSTRRGNKHSTRKQGNKHSTRKQALNKETGSYFPLFPIIFSCVAHAGPLFPAIF